MVDPGRTVADDPATWTCRYCGTLGAIRIDWRFEVTPPGVRSLAGEGRTLPTRLWPYARCRTTLGGCGHLSRGQLVIPDDESADLDYSDDRLSVVTVSAPWDRDQIDALVDWQSPSTPVTPYRCQSDRHGDGRPALAPQREGMVCPDPDCDYRQESASFLVRGEDTIERVGDIIRRSYE